MCRTSLAVTACAWKDARVGTGCLGLDQVGRRSGSILVPLPTVCEGKETVFAVPASSPSLALHTSAKRAQFIRLSVFPGTVLDVQVCNTAVPSQHCLQLFVQVGVILVQLCQLHYVFPTGFLAHLLGWAGQKVPRGKGAGDVAWQAGTGREQQPPLLCAPCPSPCQADAEACGGMGGQPSVAAALPCAGGMSPLLQVQCQVSPKMSFLDLCLHLRDQRWLLVPRGSTPASPSPAPLPFPFPWFSLIVIFPLPSSKSFPSPLRTA